MAELGTDKGIVPHDLQCLVRALKLEDKKYHQLVYFPEKCSYPVIKSRPSYQEDYDAMIQRVLYLAKTRTKHNEDGWRNFSCSRG